MSSDPFECVVNTAISSLLKAFDPATDPLGGGTTDVHFFAGDTLPTAAWNVHTDEIGCETPFVWVRLERRFRSGVTFPAPYIGDNPCPMPRALAIEMGVARCAVAQENPTWEMYEREAEISMDDSWRLNVAMCWAAKTIVHESCATHTGMDVLLPYGPEGGFIAWTGTMYVME